jgi:hypothetical protein
VTEHTWLASKRIEPSKCDKLIGYAVQFAFNDFSNSP